MEQNAQIPSFKGASVQKPHPLLDPSNVGRSGRPSPLTAFPTWAWLRRYSLSGQLFSGFLNLNFSRLHELSPPVSNTFMLGRKHGRCVMYTIKGLLDKDGQAAVLASGKDWNETREKAAEMRKQGLGVEIWHENGVKVPEPEVDLNA